MTVKTFYTIQLKMSSPFTIDLCDTRVMLVSIYSHAEKRGITIEDALQELTTLARLGFLAVYSVDEEGYPLFKYGQRTLKARHRWN